MKIEQIKKVVDHSRQQGESLVAIMALSSLRHLRDNCTQEWDAMLAADSNNVAVGLWDYLTSVLDEYPNTI